MSNTDGESDAMKEKNLLSLYEELFSDRFTDSDAEYMRTSQQANSPPPCVENWYTRPKRTFDWTRNQPDHRGRGGYNRRPYGGHFSHRESDSNQQHWREGNRDGDGYRGGYYGRRDQFLPRDNYNRVHYAGVREQSSHEAPAPKYNRQTNDGQTH